MTELRGDFLRCPDNFGYIRGSPISKLLAKIFGLGRSPLPPWS